jgi:hypothetical protein
MEPVRKNAQWLIAAIATSLADVGCSSLGIQPYERPELFHPPTERTKARIEGRLAPGAPKEPGLRVTASPPPPFVVGGSDIEITVEDESCSPDRGPALKIVSGLTSQLPQTFGSARKANLIIDGRSLSGADVTIEVVRCNTTRVTRQTFAVRSAGAARSTIPELAVIGPKPNVMLRGETYAIQIYDKCDGPSGPVVTSSVPSTLQPGVPPREGNYWNYSIVVPPDPKVQEIEITTRSCNAAMLAPNEAERNGLVKRVQYQVAEKQFKKVTSKLVVWSKQDTAQEFGATFAESFYAADAVFINENDLPLLVYGSSLTASIRFSPSTEDVKKHYSEKVLANPDLLFTTYDDKGNPIADRLNWKESWRPMSFSDILAIFSYQQEGDPRKRFIEWLKAAGVVATGAAVFATGPDYAKAVALFTGVVNPVLEKQLLWDVTLHLQNLQNRALKEIEEVAPNGQLRKVVFFPRREIYGILPEMPVYISEIKDTPAEISVTLIKKEATITQ